MHVRRALALALVVPLLLAGCTEDEPEPIMPDPPTTSSTPTPTDTETPEAESAEDFIRRWAAVETEMENTGDTSEYRELSSECKACTDLARTVEKFYAAGGYIKWDGWSIQSIRRQSDSDRHAFLVEVRSAPTEYRESAEGPIKNFDGGVSTHILRLAKDGQSWVIIDKAERA